MRTFGFDRAEALDRAMALFWRKGYANTSIEDLVTETGVSRYGLYGLYGDKRGLFVAALDLYCDRQTDAFLRSLEAPGARLANVREFFAAMSGFLQEPAASAGCLVCNSAVEFAGADKTVAERLAQHFERVEAAFFEALARAKAAGEIGTAAEPRALAIYLSGIAQAAFIQLRAGASATKVETFLSTALTVIDFAAAEARGSKAPPKKDIEP